MDKRTARFRRRRLHTHGERQERVLARTFRTRMPYAMLAFLALLGAAAVPELIMNPDRLSAYAMAYALEAQLWLLALAMTRTRALSYARAVAIAIGVTLGTMTLITAYHSYTAADADALLIALAYVSVGAMIVFPWKMGTQFVAAASSVLAYLVGVTLGVPVTSTVALGATNLLTIAAITVAISAMVEQYRNRGLPLAANS